MQVIKRDGRIVDFDRQKIAAAIGKANAEVKPREREVKKILRELLNMLKDQIKKEFLLKIFKISLKKS